MENRFPIFDVSPQIYYGDELIPAKAIANEAINIRATAIREGHNFPNVEVVLLDPFGIEVSRTRMHEYWPGTDRYEADITPTGLGIWYFYIEVLDETRELSTQSASYPIYVEADRALVGAWYEFFPRSEGAVLKSDGTIKSGTFKSAEKSLQRVANMKFDVLYLPPIHPIGYAFRKGRNNTMTPTPTDPGVPWAIGNVDGGHDSINPDLGTMKDFEHFVKAAKKLDIEIALDFALQCSPDHPWAKDHPEWFTIRSDGTIAYAENPPKKYQDIYPINFDKDFEGMLKESYRILKLWISKGVKLFRVDNPHTKPVQFWYELIHMINLEYPDVVFLSEAFTRPAMMHALGKVGFQQSYTYFTWRTSKEELTTYVNELVRDSSAFFRPNFWVNTPDILPFHLQSGAPSIFAMRALLAATLTPSWGMYAGYELYEHTPIREGAEEYLDSEKYEIKVRDWSKPNLASFVGLLNTIRRENRALQRLRNLRFHPTDSDKIIAYSKRDGDNLILVLVNLDPIHAQETIVHWNFFDLGFRERSFQVKDLITGHSFEYTPHSWVRIDPTAPGTPVGHILKVTL
ncbi:MAG: maltotransferase domain-containing protein [Actinomycetota bacterium]